MKHLFTFFVFALLLSSCSQKEFIATTPVKKSNTAVSNAETKNAADNFIAANIHTQKTATNPRDYYDDAFLELQAMLNGQKAASFKDAVFITENAWFDNKLSYTNYNNYIKALATVCKEWKKANHLTKYGEDDSLQIALSGAIYKAMTDTLKDETGRLISVPYGYNFNDAFADKYWADRFVTNLMETHKGNCHSLPFLYKIVAEELHIPAYLSFMPGHIYIKQYSKQYNWYNTELTSKTFPVDAWLMASGYVSTESIVSGIYMDTLGLKQSIAVCINDLAKGYEREFGSRDTLENDDVTAFVLKCCNLGLSYYPNYAELLLLKAETLKKLYIIGKGHYPEMEQAYAKLTALDYREIPDAMYYRWMGSLVKGDTVWNRKADSLIKPFNPFASIGQKPKGYLTLSNGYYDENFVNDTLRRIGSVVFNTITNKIDRFIKDEGQLAKHKDNSRFLSIDPLAAKYPMLSPYAFVANSPIRFKDDDGRKIVDAQGNIAAVLNPNTGEIIFTKYATEDIKTVINAMGHTTIGIQKAQDMVTSVNEIQIEINHNDIKSDDNGKIIDAETTPTHKEHSQDDPPKTELPNVKITIYEKAIKQELEVPPGFASTIGDYFGTGTAVIISYFTLEEDIGANATHEATHATEKKSNSNVIGHDKDVEKEPQQNTLDFFKQSGGKNGHQRTKPSKPKKSDNPAAPTPPSEPHSKF